MKYNGEYKFNTARTLNLKLKNEKILLLVLQKALVEKQRCGLKKKQSLILVGRNEKELKKTDQ